MGISGGLTKSGAGTLTISANNSYTGATTINQGMLKLPSLSTNAIFFNQALVINNGGTLDMNGSIQFVASLSTGGSGFVDGTGGTVINSNAAEATLVMGAGSVNWGGSINGNITVVHARQAGNTQNNYSAQGYTGKTIVMGGLLNILDFATLLNTSAIELNHSNMQIGQNAAFGTTINNRINDAAPIILRGGAISFRQRTSTDASETLGVVTLMEGQNTIETAASNTGVSSSVLTLSGLTNAAGSRSTLFFRSVTGVAGNSARVFLTTPANAANAPTELNGGLRNGLLVNASGMTGWAYVDREFASYTVGTGIGALSQTGYRGYFPTADPLNPANDINVAGANDNVRTTAINGTGTNALLLSGNRTINTLNMNVSGNSTLNFGGNTLTLAGNGLIMNQGSDNIGTVSVLSSSTTSPVITVAAVPQQLVVGSSLVFVVGSANVTTTVAAINGNTITLAANAPLNTNVPTTQNFRSANATLVNLANGSLTSGTTNAAADLYIHILPFETSNFTTGGNAIRLFKLGVDIKNNTAGGAVSLVLGGNIGLAGTLGSSQGTLITSNTTFYEKVVTATTFGSAIITVADPVNTFDGQTVSGLGVPPGTFIVSGGGTKTLVLSNVVTNTNANVNYRFGTPGASVVTGGLNDAETNIFRLTTANPNLHVGQTVTGAGIDPGTSIVAISADGLTVTLSANTTASITGFTAGTNGSNTYTGGTYINSGSWVLNNPLANGGDPLLGGVNTIPGDITISGGLNEEQNSQTYGGTVQFAGPNQIRHTAIAHMLGNSLLNINGFTQTLGGIQFRNTGGAAPEVRLLNGSLTLNGDISSTSSSPGNVALISAAPVATILTSLTTAGSPVVNISIGNTLGLVVGSTVTGPGIPIGTTVVSINSPTSITLSANASAADETELTFTSGNLSFGGSTRTINVDKITVNGLNVAPVQPALNITARIVEGRTDELTPVVGLVKTGEGVLQLSSGLSNYQGGTLVTSGGLIIGANSTGNLVGAPVTAGPIGTGTLTIGDGVTLQSSGAFTIGNTFVAQGDIRFDGINNLTLNGDATFQASTVNILMNVPNVLVTFGGKIEDAHTINKTGFGTLAFSNSILPAGAVNSSTISGTTNVFDGALRLIGAAGVATITPLGTSSIVLKGGSLELRSNSTSNFSTVIFGNNVTADAAQPSITINVNNNGANTNNTIQMGTLGMTAGQTLFITNANAYNLRFTGGNYSHSAGYVSGTESVNFNTVTGSYLTVGGGFTNNLTYANTGSGTLLLGGNNSFTTNTTLTNASIGAAPVANATNTTFGTGAVTLANGATMVISPIAGMPQQSHVGYTQGGLKASFVSGGGNNLNSALGSGATPGAVRVGQGLGDPGFNNLPTVVTQRNGTLLTMSGLIQITTGGEYTFQIAEDDQSQLIIDGIVVAGVNTGTAGGVKVQSLNALGTGKINLSAGFHSIVFKVNNLAATTGAGGYSLLYGGPDTAGNGLPSGVNNITPIGTNLQGIPDAKLWWTTDAASAANNYGSAARITNNFSVDASATVTLDGQGTNINTGIESLTLGNNSTIVVNNQMGDGWIGVIGNTTVGSGVTINTGSAMFNLIGGVTNSGNAITKTGNGTLVLGASPGTFTGNLTVNQGFLQITSPNSLPTGGGNTVITTVDRPSLPPTAATTTVASSAVIVGDTSVLKLGMSVSGTGIPANAFVAAIVSPTEFTLSANATAAGTNNLTFDESRLVISGVTAANNLTITGLSTTSNLAVGMAVTGTNIPAGTFISSIVSATSITISQAASAAATTNLTFNTDTFGSMDLNGQTGVVGNITLNGIPPIFRNTITPATLFNSSKTTASVLGTISIGTLANPLAPAIGGFGDIIINGVIQNGGTAGVAWSKVGSGVVTLNGNNTFTGALTVGSGLLKLGHVNALGAASGGVIVNAGATLDLNGLTITRTEALTINGAGVLGQEQDNLLAALVNSSPTTAEYFGTVALGSAASIGSTSLSPGSDFILRGVVSGTTLLTKVGGNTVTFTGSNTMSGGMTINFGAVVASGGGILQSGGTLTNAITVNQRGTLTLDNGGTNTANRLGAHALTLGGATFNFFGNNSANSLETTAQALTIGAGGSVITLTAPSGSFGTTFTNATLAGGTAGATALFRGTNLGTAVAGPGVTNMIFTTAPTAIGSQTLTVGNNTRGILPWAIVDTSATGLGISFAAPSQGTSFGLQALSASERVNNTFATADANVYFSAGNTTAPVGNTRVNSFTFTGGTATINSGTTLLLFSGGVLATSTGAISGSGVLSTQGNNLQMFFHVTGSSTLTVEPNIYTTGGVTKAGNGTLILSGPKTYLGNTVINGGTLKLSGGNQTIFTPFTTAPAIGGLNSAPSGQIFQINNGILDLNGTNLSVANLNSASAFPGAGGNIINSDLNPVSTLRIGFSAAQAFAGSIGSTGANNINVVRDGGNIWTVSSNNTFTGTLTLQGGNTFLTNTGTFIGASDITIRRAALVWDDTGNQSLPQVVVGNLIEGGRLSSTSPITLDGGSFIYQSRASTAGKVTVGDVTLAGGHSVIAAAPTSGTAELTIGGIAGRALGSTVTFSGSAANGAGAVGENGRIFFGNGAPTLTNGIIGGWAVAFGVDPVAGGAVNYEFATYDPATGVRLAGPYLTVFTTGTLTPGTALQNTNVRIGGTVTLGIGGGTVNSLSMNQAAAVLNFTNTNNLLTIQSGGILGGVDNTARTIGSTAVRGRITAGVGQQELFFHLGQNVMTVNSNIEDNGAALNVVLNGLGQPQPTITLTGSNTYTGTTFVNGVIVNLQTTTPGALSVPGNLVISGGVSQSAVDSLPIANALVHLRADNQIVDTATVTLKGGAQIQMNYFNETIASLTITNDGGSNGNNGPGIVSTGGILTVTGAITATNLTNANSIPVLNGFLNASAGQTFIVDPSAVLPGADRPGGECSHDGRQRHHQERQWRVEHRWPEQPEWNRDGQ